MPLQVFNHLFWQRSFNLGVDDLASKRGGGSMEDLKNFQPLDKEYCIKGVLLGRNIVQRKNAAISADIDLLYFKQTYVPGRST